MSALATISNKDNLSSYLSEIGRYPVLTASREKELASKVFYHNDTNAMHDLALPHLRFVAYIAKSFSGYGMQMLDIIQAGNIGLIKAIKRFNPSRDIRLVSFAIHWIKSEIHEFVIRNWSLVKVATTKEQRKLFFNLRKNKNDSSWVSEEQASNIAKKLNVSVKEVLTMDGRLSGKDKQLDNDDYGEKQDDDISIRHENDNWREHVSSELRTALSKLDNRSSDIVFNRWLTNEKVTLSDLADKHNLSAERVRQLEVAALAKLKNMLGHIPMVTAT
ncbi:RNA polymerase factor sigma-32 [Vibrio sp. 10N.286.49.C2]|uniref:RNA polymerase factor sigma-32 n=1 Tax=unclassified Vibrio TaxID=2614977 RepID=UPI000C84780B|nr:MULTISPECIES: RNA polymerase factor sigma-32 [unclassified Vibrio]PMH37692.1 RNA polymerase factor sigma-32 [Vibrio sp. 10N.286.49.C2]PMH45143.1 RNA polymerase factor sigma-32 [Vibrio sp. 10N.286.49.B1]PMH79100.1 RNA polymerase factor sigma-32 [Vibrio sp. 10N.286.48.B7]